jgi:hypothetical protein
MDNQSEFYVGYLPPPAGLRKAMRAAVAALLLIACGMAVVLIAGQNPFANSTFEFQQYRQFRGALLMSPYPSLWIAGERSPWLLVDQGKHGITDLARFNGAQVSLTGERIFRGEDRMIQVRPDSLRVVGAGVQPVPVPLGVVQFTGEIVDSKCYFGVMNPGSGKVHRDCAARCISGGIPPALLVRDAAGYARTVLLAGWRRELLGRIAEPVTLRGRLDRTGDRLTLHLE